MISRALPSSSWLRWPAGASRGAQLRDLKPFLIEDDDGRLRATEREQPVFTANAGTISDRCYFTLRVAEGEPPLGKLDEEFVWRPKVGDHFTLGARHGRIVRMGQEAVEVTPTERSDVMAPFWKAEQRDRSWETASAIAVLLATLDTSAHGWRAWHEQLVRAEGFIATAAAQLISYVQRKAQATGGLPHRYREVAERSREFDGREVLLIHACWGRRAPPRSTSCPRVAVQPSAAGRPPVPCRAYRRH